MRPALRKLELLAPARDLEVARQAILHGADAIYMGGPSHGARAAATNSVDDIAEAVRLAHPYGVRVYVTLNTLIYDDELPRVKALVEDYWRIGVDALIVQDMGLLRLDLPPMALHASTQCDIRTPQKAAMLAACGFSQLVLPRELSLGEIRAMREAVPRSVELEAFVHGALCVSYSGDCQASYVANGRSANRGECAQMCRMAYDLVDAGGRVIESDKHLLSLKDMCRLDDLEAMAEAGISSFKIEGRLKDANYVKTVVSAYRERLDGIIAAHPDRFERASQGRSVISFVPDVNKAFNRRFTDYFLKADTSARPLPSASIANFSTPKWIGEEVGVACSCNGRSIVARLSKPLSNGDGIGYFDGDGKFCGFRLNKIEGNRLYPEAARRGEAIRIAPRTVLYRNSDTKLSAMLDKETAARRIPLSMRLYMAADGRICVNADDVATVAMALPTSLARTDQAEQRRRVMSKLGDTIYELASLDDSLPGDLFVPASGLADLRRKAIAAYEAVKRATYRYDMRRSEDMSALLPEGERITYHDNVANSQAEAFYRDHGATQIERAMEAGRNVADGDVVMTTRYCLRREMGACLRQSNARRLPAELYLQNKAARYRLRFDCDRCQMQLLACPRK